MREKTISVSGGNCSKTSTFTTEEQNSIITSLFVNASSDITFTKNNFLDASAFIGAVSPLLLLSQSSVSSSIPGTSEISMEAPAKAGFIWNYRVDKNSEIAKYNDMKAKIDAIVAAAPEDYTAKLRYFADYICDNATYDYDSYNSNTDDYVNDCYYVEGFFSDGKVVCQGYAYTFYTLCYYAGIECALVPIKTERGHMFNAVKVDGVWKKIDTCWMDGDDNNRNYGYFLCEPNIDMTSLDGVASATVEVVDK